MIAVREAVKYLGAPYVWAGSSPTTGFDCSGFTMYVFGKLGISLPHKAAYQATYGTSVPKDQLLGVDEVAKLVAKGPEAGKYVLLDSRPDNFYNEGHIPTAVSMPFFAFDKLAETLLPKDKEILQIYYCSGFS